MHSLWSKSYQAPKVLQALSKQRAFTSMGEDRAVPSQNTLHIYVHLLQVLRTPCSTHMCTQPMCAHTNTCIYPCVSATHA